MKDRIKLVRAARNLTQAEFAEQIGLSRNYIAQVEMGIRDLGPRAVRDICRVFEINESWLRTGEGEMETSKDRKQELEALVKSIMEDSTESFRSALVTTLLRFDPKGPEWEILERIYDEIANSRNPDK